MHGIGVTDALSDVPSVVVALFAALTQLGDAWFIFGTLTLVYWVADERLFEAPRRRGALLVSLAVVALAVTTGLKSLFAVPRPPGAGTVTPPVWLPAAVDPLFVSAATGDGFGFPSGHATGSTLVYGGLAAALSRFPRRPRVVAAGVVVGVVSLSRLVLGVHHFFDVLAGVAVGVAVLWAVLAFWDGRPVRAFGLAAAAAAAALVVAVAAGHAAEAHDAGIALGSALGGAGAWRAFDPADSPSVRPSLAVLGLLAVGVLWGGSYALVDGVALSVVANAAVVAAVVGYPVLVARLDPSDATAGST